MSAERALVARRALFAFAAAAVGFGAARALTTTYVPVLLDRISDAPALIGLIMLINAVAGLAVPVVAGVVVDRRRAGRLGQRGGLIAAGAAITAGGLLAVTTGLDGTYVGLAAASAAIYAGLNAATTAHRAIVADAFADAERPRATSAQELAALLGGLVGTLSGGALIDASPAAAFALVAVVVGVTLLPTLRLRLVRDAGVGPQPARASRRELAEIARLPGAREVLLAQILWVTAYAALPTFLILYADHVLGLSHGAASVIVVAFGAFTGLGTLVAGRLPSDHVARGLLAGVVLMGLGALAAIPANGTAAAAIPFAAVALGEGLATALGYPYFTRFVPADRSGRAAGLFFSVRSIGSAVALPVAGGLAATVGYRWIWALGATSLLAALPLLRTLPRAARRPALEPLRGVAVVIPYLASERAAEVARRAVAQPGVRRVVLVDDGAGPALAAQVDSLAAQDDRVLSLHPGAHAGKAGAVATGWDAVRGDDAVDALAVVDSDGQHPPERLPAFLAAAGDHGVAIGNRLARAGEMPRIRRLSNGVASAALTLRTRHHVPDSQNGMRLYRRDVLERVPLPTGSYDAETAHLRALLRGGETVAWVSIPTIYEGEPSGFRPLADSARVLAAIARRGDAPVRSSRSQALRDHLGLWTPRLGLVVAAGWLVGAMLPLLQPLDNRLYLAVNHLGDGPDWLYDAVDPHLRNYLLITLLAALSAGIAARSLRRALGAATTVAIAGMGADLLMQLVRLWTDRPRPEEVLGSQAWLSHGRDWSHIASFPSGHLVVTSAMVVAAIAAAPHLRGVLLPYLAVIAATRILFGAHFPSDVLVGIVVGTAAGLFVADGARILRLIGPRTAPSRSSPRFRTELVH